MSTFLSTSLSNCSTQTTMEKTPMMIIFFAALLSRSPSVGAYKNYTVGDNLGWYDNLKIPDVDYQKWVAGKNFSLGDFLIFNTDTNHSVVQTYNSTTYKLCDYEDSSDDTMQWSASDPSNTDTHGVTVSVPLLKEGLIYFFSSDYDGEQCQNGQRFQINVTHGQGLPKEEEQAPGPVTADDEAAPDTIVPSNFDHPLQEEDDDDDGSVSADAQRIRSFKLRHIVGCLVGLVLIFV